MIFLPVFSEYFRKNEKEAWQMVNDVLNSFLLILIILCGISAIFSPYLICISGPVVDIETKSTSI